MRENIVIPMREISSFRSKEYCHSQAKSIVIPTRAAQRNLLSQAASLHSPHRHRAPPLPFCRTLQNELTPNHANVKVKQIATTTRPSPARPASYFAYSRAAANPPLVAITRKISPVTSSHNWCSTRPKARVVAVTA